MSVELRETELSLKEIRKQMAETEKQIKQLEKQERVQKAKLAKQVDAIYRSGVNPSTLERMLSEDAKKAERMKVYYQHLNQVRIDMINNLKATQESLAKQREAISGQQKIIAINFLRKRNSSKNYKKRNKNANLR